MILVIIAAGQGSRLQKITRGTHKTLQYIGGKRLIEHIVDNATLCGVSSIVVVTGYQHDILETKLSEIDTSIPLDYVCNSDWEKPNGISVLAAQEVIPEGEQFLISMSDHFYSSSLLQHVMDSSLENTIVNVGVDFNVNDIFDIDDGMKVKVDFEDKRTVLAMSKNLPNFDAIDCGVFKCRHEFFSTLEKATNEQKKYSLSDACNILIKERKLGYTDIKDSFWLDIDTPEALHYCNLQLEQNFPNRI